MKAVVVHDTYSDAPEVILRLGNSRDSQLGLTRGREYVIWAISRWKHVLFFQVINDANLPDWLPAWFFRLTERSLPHDWIFNLFENELEVVIGPTFVATDASAYRAMVELHPLSVEAFWLNVHKWEDLQETKEGEGL